MPGMQHWALTTSGVVLSLVFAASFAPRSSGDADLVQGSIAVKKVSFGAQLLAGLPPEAGDALGLLQHAAAAARTRHERTGRANSTLATASRGGTSAASRAAVSSAVAAPQSASSRSAPSARREFAPLDVSAVAGHLSAEPPSLELDREHNVTSAGRPIPEPPHIEWERGLNVTVAALFQTLRSMRPSFSFKFSGAEIWAAAWRHPEIVAYFQELAALGDGKEFLPEKADRMGRIFALAPELRWQLQTALANASNLGSSAEGTRLSPRIARRLMLNTTSNGALIELLTDKAIVSKLMAYKGGDPREAFHFLVERSEVLREVWNDAMVPDIRFCRNVGLIGNVVLIAAVCALTSVKSRSLAKQKTDQSSAASMEKILRRDITAAELAQHALPGDLWLAVDGMVCDITDFTAVHPGGADLLLQYAGRDASEQFREVGHSDFAVELIRARLKGVLVEGDSDGPAGSGQSLLEEKSYGEEMKRALKRVLPSQVFALFTREDPYNLHKFLGLTVVVNFFVRWYFAVSGQWLLDGQIRDPMLFGGDWFSLASCWFCILLQISSFQFVLPRNRVLGRPMLWQEWRAHNLIFVLRSLVAFTASWYNSHYETTKFSRLITTFVCFLAVLGQLYFADVASRALRDSKHESLTASWPLWEGCPPLVERFLKFYYSIGINQLTSMSLSAGKDVHSSSMMATFCGVILLQTDSFAMTLVRKNIISTPRFHAFYLWNMWALAFLVQHTNARMAYEIGGTRAYWINVNLNSWGIPLSVYIVRYLGLSKYGCWAGYMVKILLMQTTDWDEDWTWFACPVVWSLWALGQLALSGYVFEYRIRRFLEGGRPKPLVLKERERLSSSLHRLRFELPSGYACGMMPGQHMRVLTPNVSQGCQTWNGLENPEQGAADLSRSYTPISSPDSSSLEILVKHYAKDATTGFPQGGRASSFLVEQLAVGGEVLASGPHGQRIYFGNGLFEVEVGKPKIRPRVCAVVAGGSGITPALSVIREIQAEARRKADKSEAWRMMDYENEVGISAFHVLHANRTMDDALPQSFYDDSSQREQLVPVHVCNLATRAKAENEGQPIGNQEPSQAQERCISRHGPLTAKLIEEVFPSPSDDVLVILCGPHSFIAQLCQPLFCELGFRQVVAMW